VTVLQKICFVLSFFIFHLSLPFYCFQLSALCSSQRLNFFTFLPGPVERSEIPILFIGAELDHRIELKGLTADKDEALDACYEWAKKLRMRFQLSFGRNSAQLLSFPSKQLADAKDSETKMMPVMETLIKLAADHHNALTAVGQTEAVRDAGPGLLEDLRETDAAPPRK